MSLPDAIARFEAALERADHPLLQRLGPGLPRATVIRRFDRAGLTIPDEAVDLWGWRNGVEPDPENDHGANSHQLPGGFDLLSVDQAIGSHHAFLRDFPFADIDAIRPEWLEVLRAGRRCLRLDLRVERDQPVPVLPHHIDETDPGYPEANRLDSLSDLFDAMARLLDEGHWVFGGWQWAFVPGFDRHHRSAYPWLS